jgi:hypothetical protein
MAWSIVGISPRKGDHPHGRRDLFDKPGDAVAPSACPIPWNASAANPRYVVVWLPGRRKS